MHIRTYMCMCKRANECSCQHCFCIIKDRQPDRQTGRQAGRYASYCIIEKRCMYMHTYIHAMHSYVSFKEICIEIFYRILPVTDHKICQHTISMDSVKIFTQQK